MTKTIIVAGPTASGKSGLAIELARHFGGEIINADSVAVYRGFDIGAAKPTEKERDLVPHHLFDLFESEEDCDAGLYAKLAKEKISEVHSRGKVAFVVGGTGLYIRALLGESFHDLPHDPEVREKLVAKSKEELYELLKVNDPGRAAQLHPNDHFRLARALEIFYITGKTLDELTAEKPKPSGIDSLFIALDPPRDVLQNRIELRTEQMIRKGLVNEVRELLASGVSKTAKPMQSIGYKEVVEFLDTEPQDWDELRERITISTRQFARRQCTWFKKVHKDLHLEKVDFEAAKEMLEKKLG